MSRSLKIAFAVAAAAIVVVAVSVARAQQPPEDGRIAVYRQLLTQANDNVAALGAQLQAAQIENAKLKAQIEKTKPPAPIQSDGKPAAPAIPLNQP